MEQLKRIWTSMSVGQRFSIGLIAIMAVVGLSWFTTWRYEGTFKPLYRGLDSDSAAAAVEKLRETGVEFRLADNGGTILVTADKLDETRLALAREGLPKSGRMGFELFDQNNFGTTDFTEQINYRRALEGELERTIATLGEVERARVHLTFAKDSVFTDSRQPAKASILLNLRRSTSLSEVNVAAITNLVASGVEGLAPSQVTIVDSRGNLLNKPRAEGVAGGMMPDGQLEYRVAVERELQNKLAQTLDPVLGLGNYRAGVSVDVDFSGLEESEEIWDPMNSVMTSSQKTEESNAVPAAAGVPGTQSALPDAAPRPSPTTGGTTRRTENVTYQTSKKVRHTQQQRGQVKRITIAVLLDQEGRWEGTGAEKNLVLTPPAPERVEVIRKLVTNVAGINMERGDQITVDSIPFDSTLHQEPPLEGDPNAPVTAPLTLVDQLKNPFVLGGIGGGVLVVVGLVVWMMKRGAAAKKKAVLATANAIEAGGAPGQLVKTGTEILTQDEVTRIERDLLESLKLQPRTISKSDTLAKYLRSEVKKDPRAAAEMLRAWLLEGGQ